MNGRVSVTLMIMVLTQGLNFLAKVQTFLKVRMVSRIKENEIGRSYAMEEAFDTYPRFSIIEKLPTNPRIHQPFEEYEKI